MDAVSSRGFAKARHPPRGTLLGRHPIIPRRIGHLVFYKHPLSGFKIMAKKPNPKISSGDLEPYENDDVTIHIDDE